MKLEIVLLLICVTFTGILANGKSDKNFRRSGDYHKNEAKDHLDLKREFEYGKLEEMWKKAKNVSAV